MTATLSSCKTAPSDASWVHDNAPKLTKLKVSLEKLASGRSLQPWAFNNARQNPAASARIGRDVRPMKAKSKLPTTPRRRACGGAKCAPTPANNPAIPCAPPRPSSKRSHRLTHRINCSWATTLTNVQRPSSKRSQGIQGVESVSRGVDFPNEKLCSLSDSKAKTHTNIERTSP